MFSPRLSHNLHEASGIVPSSDQQTPNALLSMRASMKTAKKKKKLSSKGKEKIAEARAKEALKSVKMLEKEKGNEKEKSMSKGSAAASPRSPKTPKTPKSPREEKEKDKKTVDKPKSTKAQLEQLKRIELERLEAEEEARKEKKAQKFTNFMLNAQRSGQKVRDWERLNQEEKEKKSKSKKGKEKEKGKDETKIELKEPCEVIKEIIELCLKGRAAAVEYLKLENSQKLLHETEFKLMKASLEFIMKNRPSPINFKIELLWRFAVIMFETAGVLAPRREVNLKLSHFAYNLILQHASADSHPLHYAVLKNSLELCELELDKLEYQKLMNRNNAEFLFEPPKFSETYESEKIVFRMKKPLGPQKVVPPPVIDIEAIKARRMSLESNHGF